MPLVHFNPLPVPALAFTQQEALLLLRASIDTNDKLDWAIGTSTCSWQGITCDAGGAVTAIDLQDTGLVGQLPTDSAVWSALSSVTDIVLSDNDISGILPGSMASLTGLRYLALGNNSLAGGLPAEWSSLKGLVGLDLSNNTLSGSLPASWGSLSSLTVRGMERGRRGCTFWQDSLSILYIDTIS